MNIEPLVNRVLELYKDGGTPGRAEIMRCVERYSYKKLSAAKLEYLTDRLFSKHDIESLARAYRNRINLSDTTESVLMQSLRQAHRNRTQLRLEDLNDLQFRSLSQLILKQYGYELLFLPPLKSGPIDFLVFKKRDKIAVSCIQRAPGFSVTQKTVTGIIAKSKQLFCDRSIILTSGRFDDDVLFLAESNRIYLIDRDKLSQLMDDLAENKINAENSILETEQAFGERDSFHLEADIHSLKTKVRIVNISYRSDRENNELIFEGDVMNAGKTPVRRLTANLYVFGRESGIIQGVNQLIGDGMLVNGDSRDFRCVIQNMTDFQWLDVCRYRIKLSYQNI